MCLVVPRRVGVFATALLYVLLSFVGLGYLWFQAIKHSAGAKHVPSCQMGNCEDRVFALFTCAHTVDFTWYAIDAFVIFGGLVFGILALKGLNDDVPSDIFAFAYFLYASVALTLLCIAFDFAYMELCQKAPTLWLGVLAVAVPKKYELVMRLGYLPSATPIDDLSAMMSVSVTTVVVCVLVGLMCVFAYFAHHTWWLAQLWQNGPAGMGPMYGVVIDPEDMREWKAAVHDLVEHAKAYALEEEDYSTPFKQLKPSLLEAGEQPSDVLRYKWLPIAEPHNEGVHFDARTRDEMRGDPEREPLHLRAGLSYGATRDDYRDRHDDQWYNRGSVYGPPVYDLDTPRGPGDPDPPSDHTTRSVVYRA